MNGSQLDLFVAKNPAKGRRRTPLSLHHDNATDTRDEAFRKIRARAQGARARVLDLLRREGSSLSNSEIARRLDWGVNRLTGRVKELRELRDVVRDVRRTCTVTGETVWTWKAVNPQHN